MQCLLPSISLPMGNALKLRKWYKRLASFRPMGFVLDDTEQRNSSQGLGPRDQEYVLPAVQALAVNPLPLEGGRGIARTSDMTYCMRNMGQASCYSDITWTKKVILCDSSGCTVAFNPLFSRLKRGIHRLCNVRYLYVLFLESSPLSSFSQQQRSYRFRHGGRSGGIFVLFPKSSMLE